jgi:hypothetical protein
VFIFLVVSLLPDIPLISYMHSSSFTFVLHALPISSSLTWPLSVLHLTGHHALDAVVFGLWQRGSSIPWRRNSVSCRHGECVPPRMTRVNVMLLKQTKQNKKNCAHGYEEEAWNKMADGREKCVPRIPATFSVIVRARNLESRAAAVRKPVVPSFLRCRFLCWAFSRWRDVVLRMSVVHFPAVVALRELDRGTCLASLRWPDLPYLMNTSVIEKMAADIMNAAWREVLETRP